MRTLGLTFVVLIAASMSMGCPEPDDTPPTIEDMTPLVDMAPDLEVDQPQDMPVLLTGLALNKTSISIAPGDSAILTAMATYSDGTTAPRSVLWSSEDEQVAVVIDGEVIARSLGKTTITATLESLSVKCDVTVVSGMLSRVTLVPSARTLGVGKTFQLFATFYNAQDQPTQPATAPVWKSSDAQVVSVDNMGLITTIKPGQATITVTSDTLNAQSMITVDDNAPVLDRIEVLPTYAVNRGNQITIEPNAFDQDNKMFSDPGFKFTSNAPAIASVDPVTGIVTGLKVGEAKIEISASGNSVETTVTVRFDVSAIATGRAHACALANGDVYCWGAGAQGQLGRAATTAGLPEKINTTDTFDALALGGDTSCGITTQNQLYCWGANDRGQVGDGTTTNRNTPVRIGGNQLFNFVQVGQAHTCAISMDQSLHCWGDNGRGQLGAGNMAFANLPQKVNTAKWTTLGLGGAHTCAVTANKETFCWGANDQSQLGLVNTIDASSPKMVAGGLTLVQLTMGGAHSCGLSASGTPACWGDNAVGQLGDQTNNDHDSPVFVSTPAQAQFVKLVAGENHTCALAAGGKLYCWGAGASGQLGNNATQDKNNPQLISTTAIMVDINAGGAFACSLSQSNDVYCWGEGQEGQLGQVLTKSLKPVVVSL